MRKTMYVIAASMAMYSSNVAVSQELPEKILKAGAVRVGVTPTYPPMEVRDPQTNELKGFDIDLGEALAKIVGIKLDWQDTKFPQLIPGMETDRLDMVLNAMSDLPERRQNFDFLDYIKSGAQFIARQDYADVKTDTDICGKRVGTGRTTSYMRHIETWSAENCVKAGLPPVELVGVDRMPLMLLELQQGRIDLGVQGSETIPHLIDSNPGQYRIASKPFTAVYQGIMFNKNDTQLRDAFAKALKTLHENGTYKQIVEKWKLQESAVDGLMMNGEPVL